MGKVVVGAAAVVLGGWAGGSSGWRGGWWVGCGLVAVMGVQCAPHGRDLKVPDASSAVALLRSVVPDVESFVAAELKAGALTR